MRNKISSSRSHLRNYLVSQVRVTVYQVGRIVKCPVISRARKVVPDVPISYRTHLTNLVFHLKEPNKKPRIGKNKQHIRIFHGKSLDQQIAIAETIDGLYNKIVIDDRRIVICVLDSGAELSYCPAPFIDQPIYQISTLAADAGRAQSMIRQHQDLKFMLHIEFYGAF